MSEKSFAHFPNDAERTVDARVWLIAGCLLAGLGVAAGAFGAHGLQTRLKPGPDATQEERELSARRLETFETAARYQMYHALGLIAVGLVGLHARSGWLGAAGWLFVAGIVIFSGMLYGWVLTQYRPLAMIVPIGGTAFILGWVALAGACFAARQSEPIRRSSTGGESAERPATLEFELQRR